MRSIRASATFAPPAAIVSALSTLACCLPWGIGAAIGTLGLSVFFARVPALGAQSGDSIPIAANEHSLR
jgi:hypothetical protein